MSEIWVVGRGQLGGLLGQSFAELGFLVNYFTRAQPLRRAALQGPQPPELLILATGEAELPSVAQEIPAEIRQRALLVQNELSPWQLDRLGLREAQVMVVWFERKGGAAPRPVHQTKVFGANSALIVQCVERLGLPVSAPDPSERSHQLALKNCFILGANLGGLLLQEHPDLTLGDLAGAYQGAISPLLDDIIELEDRLSWPSGGLDRSRLRAELLSIWEKHPGFRARGRSAPERLARWFERAKALGLGPDFGAQLRSVLEKASRA